MDKDTKVNQKMRKKQIIEGLKRIHGPIDNFSNQTFNEIIEEFEIPLDPVAPGQSLSPVLHMIGILLEKNMKLEEQLIEKNLCE